MRLKKRAKEKNAISWKTCIALGVEDTKYNHQKYKAGLALELIADAPFEAEDKEPKPIKISAEYQKDELISEIRVLYPNIDLEEDLTIRELEEIARGSNGEK